MRPAIVLRSSPELGAAGVASPSYIPIVLHELMPSERKLTDPNALEKERRQLYSSIISVPVVDTVNVLAVVVP
jgi:hypothetical protein